MRPENGLEKENFLRKCYVMIRLEKAFGFRRVLHVGLVGSKHFLVIAFAFCLRDRI